MNTKNTLPKPTKGTGYLAGIENGDTVIHQDGDKGGIIIGERHSNGGVAAVNQSSGQHVEVEKNEVSITSGAVNNGKTFEFNGEKMTGREILSKINSDAGGVKFKNGGNVGNRTYTLNGKQMTDKEIEAELSGNKIVDNREGDKVVYRGNEVIITRPAVSDTTRRSFEGKMLTNLEILSIINQHGGGVAFTEDTELKIPTTGREYEYGGKMVRDYDIVKECGCKHDVELELTPYAQSIYNDAVARYNEIGSEGTESDFRRKQELISKAKKNVEYYRENKDGEYIQKLHDYVAAGEKFIKDYGYLPADPLLMAQGGMAQSTSIDMDAFNLLNERVANGQIIIDADSSDKTYEWHSADNKLRVKSYDVPAGNNSVKQEYMVFINDVPQRCDYNKALLLTKNYFDELYANAGYYEDGAVVVAEPAEPIQEIIPVNINLGTDADSLAIKSCIEQNREIAKQVMDAKWSRIKKLTFINNRLDEIHQAGSVANNEEVSMMYSQLHYIWQSTKSLVRMQ